jgi:hypothetical protein
MKRLIISLFLSMTALLAWSDDVSLRYDSIANGAHCIAMKYDSIAVQLNGLSNRLDSLALHLEKMSLKEDSLEEKDRWKRLVLRHGGSINDTSIV